MTEFGATKPSTEILSQCHGVEKLLAVVSFLRHPEHGCPWDLKQTHQTLKPYMLEEAYEAVEAIGTDQPDLLKEELGDVLLQVALHAQLANEAGQFDFAAVAEGIADKLIRRHPHVFSDVVAEDADAVTVNWEKIKQAEKGETAGQESILKGAGKHQPALSRALEVSKRAVKVGFEWPSLESLWECVMSEFQELETEIRNADISEADKQARLESEMGDIFFATVNLARHLKIDPEVALTRAIHKFTQRFQQMERFVHEEMPGKQLEELDFEAWDSLWNRAKAKTGMQ